MKFLDDERHALHRLLAQRSLGRGQVEAEYEISLKVADIRLLLLAGVTIAQRVQQRPDTTGHTGRRVGVDQYIRTVAIRAERNNAIE